MKLSCALVVCNENPSYLEFWPIVKKAWQEIVGIPVLLVYVGHELPPQLEGDTSVVCFPPIPMWHTATQAQCLRLLFPALIQCDGAILISDMDMIPLQPQWFHDTIEPFSNDSWVSYRESLGNQIVMCYCAATAQTWGDLFSVRSMEDIQMKLQEWATKWHTDGHRGGQGWTTDQEILFQTVSDAEVDGRMEKRLCILPDPYHHVCPRPDRLDRAIPDEWIQFPPIVKNALKAKQFIDFHMPPYGTFQENLERICDFAITHRDSPYDPQYHYKRVFDTQERVLEPTTEPHLRS